MSLAEAAQRRTFIRLVSDRRGWALDDDKQMTIDALKFSHIHTTKRKRPGRVDIFMDRFKYLASNDSTASKEIVSWFHGYPSNDSKFAKLIAALVKKANEKTTIRVSHQPMLKILRDAGITSKIATIPIGVDINRFAPSTRFKRAASREQFGIPEEFFTVGSFQKDGKGWAHGDQIKREKGPDILVSCLVKLKREGLKPFVVLTGPGRAYVRSGLDGAGIPYLHLRPRRTKELSRLFSLLDCYLIGSRDEGGPKGGLEALAAGVPVVTTPVGQIRELISDGISGVISDDFSSESLAESVLRLNSLDNSSLRRASRSVAEGIDYRKLAPLWLEAIEG